MWGFGFLVLLFCVCTSCFAVVPVNLVWLPPRLALPLAEEEFVSPVSDQQPPPPPQEGCGDSAQCQRWLRAPHGTASPGYLCYSCYSSCICLGRPVTNVLLFLVSSSASLSATLGPHLTPWPHWPPLFVSKINVLPVPLPHLGPRDTPP